jgi:hypothetical protein
MSQESIVATRQSLAGLILKDHPTRSGKVHGRCPSAASKLALGKKHGTYGTGGDLP